MRILQILPALNQGGVEYCVLENARYISRYAESFVISSGGRLVQQLEKEGSQHFTLPIEKKRISVLLQIQPLKKLILSIQPDIIHVHSRLQAWLVFFAIKSLKMQYHIITNVHGFNSVNWYSEKLLFGDRVIVVSESLKAYLELNYPKIPHEKYEVISPGLDNNIYNRTGIPSSAVLEKLSELEINFKQDRILLLPGRITRIKGHINFIRLIKKLVDEGFNDIKGVIVGGHNDRNVQFYQEVLSLISSLSLQDRIAMYGSSDDMASLYHASHIVLSMTQKPESYGKTVIEALGCGVPVLGFDVGGVKENLEKYYPFGLVPAYSDHAFFEKTKTLLNEYSHYKHVLPITDTIESSQNQLKELYLSVLAEE